MTKRLGPNVPLIREAVKLIEENEANFNMNSWIDVPYDEPICNTTLCFAGFGLIAKMGATPFFNKYLKLSRHTRWSSIARRYIREPRWVANDNNNIAGAAQKAMRLSFNEAEKLFGSFGIHNVNDLKTKITEVLGITFDNRDANAPIV